MNEKKMTTVVFDEKIVKEFQEQAKKTKEYPLDYGCMSILKRELMVLCDVTELEALNILCGHNVKDYIHKYEIKSKGKVVVPKEFEGIEHVTYVITEEERGVYENGLYGGDYARWRKG